MAYQANHGPGQSYEGDTHQGINTAYFDKDDSSDPFEHYNSNDYNRKEDEALSRDYQNNHEEEEQKKEQEKENTLIDNIKREEEKAKKADDSWTHNVSKKAADEIRHKQMAASNRLDNAPKKKKSEAHKSIEEAINDASKEKKEVFVLK
ncbi:hypothetical protein KY361_03925 [Candidatus Woesearchaeota archaeon]|nr:hypothetical protein [Candidatus Woesearchaeota archaeon]